MSAGRWLCSDCFEVVEGEEPDMGSDVEWRPEPACARCGTTAGIVFESETPFTAVDIAVRSLVDVVHAVEAVGGRVAHVAPTSGAVGYATATVVPGVVEAPQTAPSGRADALAALPSEVLALIEGATNEAAEYLADSNAECVDCDTSDAGCEDHGADHDRAAAYFELLDAVRAAQTVQATR